MGILNIFKNLFRSNDANDEPLTPEMIEHLPMADDPVFYRDSKRLLQRFDEYITAAEAESELLSIELDNTLNQEDILRKQLQALDKPGSWHERYMLLKIDRLQTHSSNLKQRIEIYSQNIKLYLNLIAKIQDVKAMRLNGLDQEKIQAIWLEFKDTLDEYRDRLSSEEAGFDTEQVTSSSQEERIVELRKELLPEVKINKEIKTSEEKPKPKTEKKEKVKAIRPPISDVLEKKEKKSSESDEELVLE